MTLEMAKTPNSLTVCHGAGSQIICVEEVKYQKMDLDLPATLLWAIVSIRTVL